MPLERPEEGWVWLHVPRKEPVTVIVCGDIYTWWAHFARVPGLRTARAVRCRRADGQPCDWCDREIGRRARYVFPVRVGEGMRLVELGRVQFSMLDMLYQSGRWIGRRLKLSREWDAQNARILVEPLGMEALTDESTVDVGEFVASLGMTEAATIRPPQVIGGSAPPGPKGSGSGSAGVRNAWADTQK